MQRGNTQENRKKIQDRPDNDFYETPVCATYELCKTGELDGGDNTNF